jgi:catalase
VRDAFGHLKAIGHVAAAAPLLERAGIEADAGLVAFGGPRSIAAFIAAAKAGRIWAREPKFRQPR